MPQKTQFPATPGIIALLVATGLCVLMQLYAAIPLVDPVAADLETSTGTATLVLSTCFSLSYAAAFLVWGPVADHVGRRPVILTGLALLVVTSVGCALAPNVMLLGVFRALQGIGAASYAPIALAYLTEATAPKHRAASVGAMATAFLVAGITGQVAASALAHESTWRWLFAGSGIVFLAFGLAVLVLLTEPARTRETTLAGQFRNLVQLLTQPRILLLAGALTTLLLSFVAMYSALGPPPGGRGLKLRCCPHVPSRRSAGHVRRPARRPPGHPDRCRRDRPRRFPARCRGPRRGGRPVRDRRRHCAGQPGLRHRRGPGGAVHDHPVRHDLGPPTVGQVWHSTVSSSSSVPAWAR